MYNLHTCPHCGEDGRSIETIIESINNLEISNLKEEDVDDIDFISFIIDLTDTEKLPPIRSDTIKTA